MLVSEMLIVRPEMELGILEESNNTYEHWVLWAMQAAEKSETLKTTSRLMAAAETAVAARRAVAKNCILNIVFSVGETGK